MIGFPVLSETARQRPDMQLRGHPESARWLLDVNRINRRSVLPKRVGSLAGWPETDRSGEGSVQFANRSMS